MSKFGLVLRDTVPFQLYSTVDGFLQNFDRLDLLLTALISTVVRNLAVLVPVYLFILKPTGGAVDGLAIVGLGATVLAYVALRSRVHTIDFVGRRDERFASPSRRKTYFDLLNVTDSLAGFVYVAVGFTLRVLTSV